MPNGFHGSKDAWRRLIAPLAEVDELLVQFAALGGMKLARNDRGWPERSLRWESDDVHRLFQIYLADEKEETYSVWVTAWKDGAEGRAWRKETIREAVPWATLCEELAELLEEGVRKVDGWSEADLVLVGR